MASPPVTDDAPAPNSTTDNAVTACVLIIGNEILSGRTQDVNLKYLAETLGGWGIQVREARVIPDVENVIVGTLNDVRPHYDYVFTTGGIGPTHDDITADCVARAFGVDLVVNEQIAELIRARPAPPDVMASRLRMARIPEGAVLVDNLTGGPPGFRMDNVFVMAGIPAVMQAMLASLEGRLQGGPVVRSWSVTAHLGESQIAAPLREIQDRYPTVDLGSYPFFRQDRYGTTLVMRSADGDALAKTFADVEQAIRDCGETPLDPVRE